MTSSQAQIVLNVTDADVAIQQLNQIQSMTADPQVQMLRKALDDAIEVIKKLRGEVTRELKTAADPKSLVLYTHDNSPPVSNLEACTQRMRTGKIRKIDRLVVAEPLFAVCLAGPGRPWESRFRIVDSMEAAHAMKILHNV